MRIMRRKPAIKVNGVSIKNTTPRVVDSELDKLARQWIELVLSHIQKAPVVFSKESSFN